MENTILHIDFKKNGHALINKNLSKKNKQKELNAFLNINKDRFILECFNVANDKYNDGKYYFNKNIVIQHYINPMNSLDISQLYINYEGEDTNGTRLALFNIHWFNGLNKKRGKKLKNEFLVMANDIYNAIISK